MATTEEIQNEIIEIYIAAFDRAPDAGGLSYWVDKVTIDNWTTQEIATSFFDSEEVALKYPPSLSNESFLNAVYNNVLGRDGDPSGIAYWLPQMENGITRDQMITTIIAGAKADSGDANDKLFLQNKQSVAFHFAVTLGLDDLSLANTILDNITTLSSSVDTSKDILDAYKDSLDTSLSLIQGDELDNTITGTDTTDYIYTYAGNDVINTGTGDNTVVAGDGIDTIHASSGNDIIKGRLGDDTLYAGDGDDFLYGNEGNDSLHAEAGDDTVYGGADDDYIYGDAGTDILYGGDGNDNIYGGEGDDSIYGENGNDNIDAGEGVNFIDAGAGNDVVYGGSGVDQIYGGIGNDTLYGLAGIDTLDGLTGDDTIYAGSDNDIINGNEGNDTLYGGLGNDNIDGEVGDDALIGGAGTDTLSGGAGNDTFTFISGDSTLTSLDIITDFQFSATGADKINVVAHGSEVIGTSKIDVSSASTLTAAADIAAALDGSINAKVQWFVYEDNTYVVEDLSADATFQDTSDIIIKLQGIIDMHGLNTSTISFT